MTIHTAIALLKGARQRIEAGEMWICYALDKEHKKGSALEESAATLLRLKAYIERELNGVALLTTWLHRDAPYAEGYTQGNLGHLCRLAWIDRMLYELETNGCLP